jgi:uncharacterized protein (DUF2252 family)
MTESHRVDGPWAPDSTPPEPQSLSSAWRRARLTSTPLRVVGVGSVGTRCYIALLIGRDRKDPLFLQIKEAQPSVLERFLGRSAHAHSGERVVAGQRVMQAASDIFLS